MESKLKFIQKKAGDEAIFILCYWLAIEFYVNFIFDALFGGAYIIAYNEFRGIGETAYFLSSTMTGNGPVN